VIFGQKRDNGSARQQGRGVIRNVLTVFLPVLVLCAAVFGVLQMAKLKPKPEDKAEAPRTAPVLTAMAQSRTLSLNIDSQGEVTPRTEIGLSNQVGGKIVYMSPSFIEGGHFNKGDVLLKLESADYDLRVTQAQANVAQAQTALTRELSEVDIAQQDWDDLGEGEASPLTLRAPQLAEARARLAASQAALDEAKLNQRRTVLRSSFRGRVREKTVSLGEYITPGQTLGRVFSIDVMDVKFPLTDNDLSKLGLGIGFVASKAAPGPDVKFSATIAGERHEWRGKLIRTSSGYDPKTRVLFAYAELQDPYGKGADRGTPFASGLFVGASIGGRGIEHGVVIPRTGLRGTDRVYIANSDNTLSIRKVKVASSTREQVVITGGLIPGEEIIISPVRSVAEGMKIEVAKKPGDLNAVVAVKDEN
jgi:RND family efflux transporter MFP subunit